MTTTKIIVAAVKKFATNPVAFITTARNYSKANTRKPIRIIVWHSAENQELPGQAAHLVQWFAGASAPKASAHYMVDRDTALQSVSDKDVAWHCDVWERNVESIGIELTGHADQTPVQWADPYSQGVINQASILGARLSKLYSIPPVHLTIAQILDGKTKGHCTHADISKAHAVNGGHTDPGVGFPMPALLSKIAALIK